MKKIIDLIRVMILGMLLVGCQSKALEVEQIWARPGLAGGNSAVYFTIDNPTNQDDALLGGSGDVSEFVEIHESLMKENGVMAMEMQETVPLPGGGKVEFEPGGLHIMLINLRSDLKPGDQFQLTLIFEKAGEQPLSVEVKEP